MRGLAPAIGAALFGLVLGVNSALAAVSVVDGFETIEGWSAVASEGAQVWLAQEPGRTGQALRIDYDLGNGSGYVIVRKSFAFPVPKNFAFTFDLLGEGQPNNFEFKLVDPSQRNVWWWRQPNVTWPTTWQTTTIRRSRLELAWGSAPTVKLQKVGSIESEKTRSYVFSVVVRVASEMRRASGRQQHVELHEHLQAPAPLDAEGLLEQKRVRELLDQVLSGLSWELRTVFVMFELEGLSSPEIADALGVSRGTIASRLRLAREAFRRGVERFQARARAPQTPLVAFVAQASKAVS